MRGLLLTVESFLLSTGCAGEKSCTGICRGIFDSSRANVGDYGPFLFNRSPQAVRSKIRLFILHLIGEKIPNCDSGR